MHSKRLRILLITGKLAYELAKDVAREVERKFDVVVDVLRLNYPVTLSISSALPQARPGTSITSYFESSSLGSFSSSAAM